MPLKSIVKVSHLSNLSDTRYCAGMGVELLGFSVLDHDEHYIPPSVFQDIRGWISGPKIIAELYGISSGEEITSAQKVYAPDYFELTFEEYRKFRDHLGLPCIVRFANPEDAKNLTPKDNIAYVLVEETTMCSDTLSIERPVLINIGSLEALQKKTEQGCFDGYVLQGPAEIRPGITNYDQLGEILEALDED